MSAYFRIHNTIMEIIMKRFIKSNSHLRIARFVLPEILAVVAIISAIPNNSYQKVKQKAYHAECTNNLTQIGQLLRMYVLENDSYPTAAFYPKDPEKGPDSIRTLLGGPKKLWTCPSLPDKLKNKGLTFVYNDTLGGKQNLRNPERKWVLIEFNCVSKNAPNPHAKGYNILFADGHIITTKRLPKKITNSQQVRLNNVYLKFRNIQLAMAN